MLPGNGLVSRDESRRLASKRHAHVHDIYVNNAMRPGDKIALGFEKDFYSFEKSALSDEQFKSLPMVATLQRRRLLSTVSASN